MPAGDQVIEDINRVAPLFSTVVTTQDWHPADHCSFREKGGQWPVHCVAGTPGAELHPRLKPGDNAVSIRKATSADREAYSGFDGTGLSVQLKERGVRRVFIAGLATDYCVKSTALDAIRAGFEVVVLGDAVRAVNVKPGDGEEALQEMRKAGAVVMESEELVPLHS